MNRIYLLLGSNIGDRLGHLETARESIRKHIGDILAQSSIYETEPWGFKADQYFLNQVLRIDSELSPSLLLQTVLAIEDLQGRKRTGKGSHESRTIDIDILFYNDDIIHTGDLSIPHPRLHQRLFTLLPLEELDEDLIHPRFNKTVWQLRDECSDTSEVTVFQKS